VDVQVDPGRPIVQPLHQQPEVRAGQFGAVVLGMPVEPAQRRPGGRAPERQLAIVCVARHVNDDLVHPAVVRHPANLCDPGPGTGRGLVAAGRGGLTGLNSPEK
jgi:hypothetical protein